MNSRSNNFQVRYNLSPNRLFLGRAHLPLFRILYHTPNPPQCIHIIVPKVLFLIFLHLFFFRIILHWNKLSLFFFLNTLLFCPLNNPMKSIR